MTVYTQGQTALKSGVRMPAVKIPAVSHQAISPPVEANPADLHVIAVFFNFQRFRNPVVNFFKFEQHMKELGVTLHVVELVLGSSPFEVTSPQNPLHTQLRTDTEFFQKENLINIGVRRAIRAFPDLEKFAWIDSDVTFFNPYVIEETLYKLDRHPVVQMWEKALDMGPDGTPMEIDTPAGKQMLVQGFPACKARGIEDIQGFRGVNYHPGYAWAMRRIVWERLGGLYEHAILGAADHQMAHAFNGNPSGGIHGLASEGYKKDATNWGERATALIRGDVGYVSGLIHHAWHGRKGDRKYVERWAIMVDTGFDPAVDLVRDDFQWGLLKLTQRSPELRDRVRGYFYGRNEDANTLA